MNFDFGKRQMILMTMMMTLSEQEENSQEEFPNS
jgi:hypothetical protein